MSEVELSIVMPCLNEAATVAACVEKAQKFLRRSGIHGEVVVADNGSSDNSIALALAAGARVVHAHEKGYGNALRAGIAEAHGRFVVMGDADDSYDFSSLEMFVSELRAGSDLVLGNRFKGGIQPGAMPPLHRFLGNPVLSFLGRLFFRIPVGDFHCGLRGFRRDSIISLKLSSSGMEFASEMIVKAGLARMRITEVPTKLYPDRRGRAPHLRTWRDGWRHLRFLLALSPRWLFLYPGFFLLTAGVGLQALLLHGSLRIGTVGLDIHTMLYAAAMSIIGVQMVWFAVFAKIHGIATGLLPQDTRLERALAALTLERGLVVGLGLVSGGLAISAFAVLRWARLEFGSLDPREVMRVAIPSVSMMVAGMEFVLASFLVGILRDGIRSMLAKASKESVVAYPASVTRSPV